MKQINLKNAYEKTGKTDFPKSRHTRFAGSFRYGLCSFVFILLGLSPDIALAHLVNTNVGEFYSGMIHPITSAEHLLPIIVLGLLASQMGKRAARGVVIFFPLTLTVGVVGGYYFPELGFVQIVNLLLLVVLGGMLIASGSSRPMIAMVLSVCTGLVLGYRSGVDMAAAAVGMQFIPGVALTGLIMVALFAAWIPEASSGSARTARTFLGTGFSLAGIVMILFLMLDVELQGIRSVGIPNQGDIVSMVKSQELSASVILAAVTGSLIWGAGHALTPGHGKAIVGAYLVGARSTPWHAVYLGFTVTATHTLVVFALGLITLFASRFILADQLYPWLGLISGLIVVGLGASLALSRIRSLRKDHSHSAHHNHDHHHDANFHVHSHNHDAHCHSPIAGHAHSACHDNHGHSHTYPHNHDHFHSHEPHHQHHKPNGHSHSHLPPGADGTPVTWRSLLSLGISGGLLPCPAALVLLLAAVSLGRVGFGMLLVTVFSLGLAGVLITVGLLFIKGGRLLAQIPQIGGYSGWIGAASALAIFGLGIIISIQAAAGI